MYVYCVESFAHIDGSSPVSFAITERRGMGLYEVPLSVSLFGFDIGIMLVNFHV